MTKAARESFEPHGDFSNEVRAPSQLRPDPRNARTHGEAQIRLIADLIATNGWTFPPLIDGDDVIIAGEGRWRAALLLGLAEMPVRVARGWSAEQRRLYVLADNKSAQLSGWDAELLADELAALAADGADLGLASWDGAEVAALLGPSEGDIGAAKVSTVEVSAVADNFWIQVSGPLGEQAKVLAALRAIERDHPAVTVRLGTTEIDA